MTDLLAGLSIGIGIGWTVLALMVASHLRYNFRLDAEQERAILWRFFFVAIFASIERITIGLLSTPTNLENMTTLDPAIYAVITIGSRLLLGLALWDCIRWIWFTFWPTMQRDGKEK